jgi:hypothetical protein
MNQLSKFKDKNGKYLPVWETWYSSEEIFLPKANCSKKRNNYIRTVSTPSQFHGNDNLIQILSFNKFNMTACKFITEPHKYNGNTYYYNSRKSLTELNDKFNKLKTALKNREISQFPNRAIETKPVFMLVKSKGLTAIPYWQGPQNSITPINPVSSTWTNCVLFDPTSTDYIRPATASETKSVSKSTNCKSYLYAGISQIYNFKLKTQEEVNGFNTVNGSKATIGDYAVLVAMHVNTKEIINWTWQTFFWSGGLSPPNNYPGDMSLQPSSLKSPWSNYAMCTAYWQEGLDGKIHTCFNPYLETDVAGIPDGLNSNCMSCHGLARTEPFNNSVSPVTSYPKNYVRKNNVGPGEYDPLYFKGNTRTDFSWAISVKAK